MYIELPEILKDKNEQIYKLEIKLQELKKENELIEKDKKFWMKKSADLEFKEKLYKGCYTNCPVGKIIK